MSGHVFFKDRWYGFDDGLYTGARLLEILAKTADPSALLNGLPDAMSTPELQLWLDEGENFRLIDKLQKEAKFDGAEEVVTIDGLRVEYPDGFGLARSSNTTPVVVMRFESETQEGQAHPGGLPSRADGREAGRQAAVLSVGGLGRHRRDGESDRRAI